MLADTHPTTFRFTAFVAAYPFTIKVFASPFGACGMSSSDFASASANRNHKQPAQGRRTPTEDVPGSNVRELPGKSVADLVCGRMRGVHSDDQQNAPDHQQNNSENALRAHNRLQ
jgi:hypothetical protein